MDLSLNILTCKTRVLNLSTGASVPVSRNKSNNGWNRIGKEWVMSKKCLAHCATCNEGLNCKLSNWTITLTARLHWKCLCIYWICSHKKFRRECLLLYSFCSWRNKAMIHLVAISDHLHLYQDGQDPATMFNHYRKAKFADFEESLAAVSLSSFALD